VGAGAEWNGFDAHLGFFPRATVGSASRHLEAMTLYSASPRHLFAWGHEPTIVASRDDGFSPQGAFCKIYGLRTARNGPSYMPL